MCNTWPKVGICCFMMSWNKNMFSCGIHKYIQKFRCILHCRAKPKCLEFTSKQILHFGLPEQYSKIVKTTPHFWTQDHPICCKTHTGPMLGWWWPNVYDAGSSSAQHWGTSCSPARLDRHLVGPCGDKCNEHQFSTTKYSVLPRRFQPPWHTIKYSSLVCKYIKILYNSISESWHNVCSERKWG